MRPLIWILLPLVVFAGPPPAIALEADVSADLSANGGAKLRWGELRSRTGVRLQADSIQVDDDVDREVGTADQLRRARLTQRIDWRDWRLRVDYDFGVSEGFKNAYLEHRGFHRMRLRAGNQVAPFSLEDNEGSATSPLMERSIASALSPGMLEGFSLRKWGDGWSVAAGLFGDEMSDADRRRAPGRSFIARGTLAPVRDAGRVLHLGAAFERREIDSGERVRLRARPYSRLVETRVLDTRWLDGVDEIRGANQELAFAWGRLKLQAEATQLDLLGSGADRSAQGGYVMMSAMLGGGGYRYSRSRGVFSAEPPEGSWGGLELAARYGWLDLGDGSLAGGNAREATIGLTWLARKQLRLQLNHSRVTASPDRNGRDVRYDVTGLRIQLSI